MTRIPLRRLRLRPGEEHRERLPLTLEPLVLGGATYEPVPGDVPSEVVIQRAASGDVFRLVFSTELDGPCMRCLAPARQEVAVDAQEYQATDPGDDEELRSDYVVDAELDVGAWARDQIAMALPDRILCRPDCAGLCPVCGKDLNVEPHDHSDVASDPRWAALEALRTEPGPDA